MRQLTILDNKILALTITIPSGKITTYREVARALGRPRSARVVGNALNKNPNLIKVPCHRVIRSNGEIGGFIKGFLRKKKLLVKEGIEIKNKKVVDLNKYLYRFK